MEENLTPEQRLKAIEEEKKKLKDQLAKQREAKKTARQDFKAGRDGELERMDTVLEGIQKEIYIYNKLGKEAKAKANILGVVVRLAQEGMKTS